MKPICVECQQFYRPKRQIHKRSDAMQREGQCSSYTMGDMICRDGFPVSAICMGVRCFSCGRYTDKVPACQNEVLDSRFLDDGGRPIYARNT